MIQQYLKNLIEFGILKRVLIFNKKEYNYDLISPLMKFYFYADERYNFSEESNQEKAKLILSELMPKFVESNIREYLAYKYGFREAILSEKDREINIYLLRFKKPALVGEVKWKKTDKEDITKAEKNLKEVRAKRKLLFVQDKKLVQPLTDLEVIDVNDLLKK